MTGIIRNSIITCPHCGFAQCEEMPVDACLFFYDCRKCGARLRPKDGDCCVFFVRLAALPAEAGGLVAARVSPGRASNP